jgi:hypothetical protein
MPPGRSPIALSARPMGNPAADPVVTHLSSVVLELGCCLPGQAGSPCTPPPSTGYPHPPVPRVPATPALTGARPPAGPLPPSATATPAIAFPPPRAPSSPMPFRNRVQRDPNQASHAANNRSCSPVRPAPPTSPGSDEVQVRSAFSWRRARCLAVRPAGSPVRWTTDVRPIGGPSWCQGQAADRARRAGRARDAGAESRASVPCR